MNRNLTSNRKSLGAIGPQARELIDAELDAVSGGNTNTDQFKQLQDMTNNQQTTAQKAAAAADAYIRS